MSCVSDALLKLSRREDLTFDEARDVMDCIMSGDCPPTLMASYLTALTVKGETVEEIAGSATEMRSHGLKLPGDHSDALEIVGTGGDRSGSFNISTTSAFVVASCGSRWPSTATGRPAADVGPPTCWRPWARS